MFDQLSLNILDIAMNSFTAGATVLQIAVLESRKTDRLTIRIRDNGQGMDEKTLQRVLTRNASTKANRKKAIGLGLAFLRQTADLCDGRFAVRSASGKGTSVMASMRLSHIDRPPLGDLNSTVLALCAANPHADVRLAYRAGDMTFDFSSQQRSHHEPRRTQETERESTTTSRAA
jgi:hypothetical protein